MAVETNLLTDGCSEPGSERSAFHGRKKILLQGNEPLDVENACSPLELRTSYSACTREPAFDRILFRRTSDVEQTTIVST